MMDAGYLLNQRWQEIRIEFKSLWTPALTDYVFLTSFLSQFVESILSSNEVNNSAYQQREKTTYLWTTR